MAAAGASGVSLALGLYNTTQIASLKETIDIITESGPRAGGSSILAPTIVPKLDVVPPPPTIESREFQQASSPDIRELQERMEELEGFSQSASDSAASNSTGLATKIGDLELFVNTTDTRSTKNEANVIMVKDELDRLSTFTSDELPKVRNRLAVAEESMGTNASMIEVLSTKAGDLESGVSAAGARIDAVVALTAAIDGTLKGTTTSVAQSAGAIEQVATSLTALTQGMDILGDEVDLVDGNEQETRKNLADLIGDWNTLKTNAYVANGNFYASNLTASACNLAFSAHDGQRSALHFAGITNPYWAMYMSSATGKGPGGNKVHAHGDVTQNAMRLKVDGNPNSGFVVENDKNVGVFSVNSEGKTRMGSGKIADIWSGTHTSFSHHAQSGAETCALSQGENGTTVLNCAPNKTVDLRSGDKTTARITQTRFDILNEGMDANQTVFNHAQKDNFIVCGTGGATKFFAGKEKNNIAWINRHGMYTNGYNVGNEIKALKKKVEDLEGKMNNALNMKKVVKFRNHQTKRYINSIGEPKALKGDTHNHYTIEYD